MDAVATGAIGDGLRAAFGRQAVEGGIEADQPVVGHAELAGEADIAVAASAGVADVGLALTLLSALVCFRILCSPWQSVQSGACVTPRARAWPCTLARNCLTTSVWHMPQVSGTAVRKAWDFGRQQFVGAAVAEGAIGRAFIAALARLAVDALVVVAGLIGVAGEAGRFGNIRRVRNFVVRFVAGVAGEGGVRALGEFLPLLVAGGALGAASSAAYRSAPATPAKRPKSTEPSLRPKEENARFIMRLGSQGGSSDELPVDISGSHQKAENDGDHGQDLAPLVDYIEFLGDGRLLRQGTVHDVQGVVFLAGDGFPPDEQSQHAMASTTQRTKNGRKSKFINNLQIRASQANLRTRANGRASG